jgi:hypothetical protein
MVQPGAEVIECQDFRNPVGSDIAVTQATSSMTKGIQRAFVYHDPSITSSTRTVSNCPGNGLAHYVHLTQSPTETVRYPSGVGRSLPGSDGLRVRLHAINAGTTAFSANFTATFQWVAPASVTHLAAELYLDDTTLIAPPGMSTQSRTFSVPYDIQLIQTESIMHRHGTHFHASAASTTLYDGTSWSAPPVNTFNTPVSIPAGTGITWSCAYSNDTSQVLVFGESVVTNEDCALAGIIYPTGTTANQGQGIDASL